MPGPTADIQPLRLSDTALISDAINQTFRARSFWVIAEVNVHTYKADKNYHFFTLVEKSPNTHEVLAKLGASANHIQVLVNVSIQYHAIYGLRAAKILSNQVMGSTEKRLVKTDGTRNSVSMTATLDKFNKIGIEELQYLITFILEKKDSPVDLMAAFGTPAFNNGQGSTFLTPADPIFKVVWVHEKDGRADAIGFGGQFNELKLSDLLAFYKQYTEGFNRFDDEYTYVFFLDKEYSHTVQVASKERVLQEGQLLMDIEVNVVGIYLR